MSHAYATQAVAASRLPRRPFRRGARRTTLLIAAVLLRLIPTGCADAVDSVSSRPVVQKLSEDQLQVAHAAGATIEVQGKGLVAITKVVVGGKPVQIVQQGHSSMRVTVPGFATERRVKIIYFQGDDRIAAQVINVAETSATFVDPLSSWQASQEYVDGSLIRLTGVHLDRLSSAMVNGVEVPIISRRAGVLEVQLRGGVAAGHADLELFEGAASVTTFEVRIGAGQGDGDTGVQPFSLGPWPSGHVQGVAVDETTQSIYLSMTDRLMKTDYSGRVLGSITGFNGHLGDLAFDPETGNVYASFENAKLDVSDANSYGSYVMVMRGSRIDHADIRPDDPDVVTSVYIREATEDVELGRYGASGIDGIAVGPSWTDGMTPTISVAYGIFRNDSGDDEQVIQQYDLSTFAASAAPHTGEPLHQSEATHLGTYSVRTGNTNFGIQTLDYDPGTRLWFATVYSGHNAQWPNYRMFAIESGMADVAFEGETAGQLTLAPGPLIHPSGVTGWKAKTGSLLTAAATGVQWLADGSVVVARRTTHADGSQSVSVVPACFIPSDTAAFGPC